MSVQIHIPTPLRAIVSHQDTLTVSSATTVGAVLTQVMVDFPGLKKHLVGEDGQFRRYVNYYLNDEDIRYMNGMDTPVRSGDQLSIIPAIAGGLR